MMLFSAEGKKAVFLALCLWGLFSSCRSREAWSEIFMKKGREYMEKQRYELAAAEYEKAIRIDRGNLQAYLEAGEVFYATHQPKRVIEMMNTAEAVSRNFPARYDFLKGESLLADGQAREAVKSFEQALKKEPDNHDYQKRLKELRSDFP